MTTTTPASFTRRRTLADWRNRPTKQLLRDYNRLRTQQQTHGLEDQERTDLHHIKTVLAERDKHGGTGGALLHGRGRQSC